ncbi:MAG: DinB family protein [Bacteroidota bacterium]
MPTSNVLLRGMLSLLLLIILSVPQPAQAQVIKPAKGYSPQIGTMVCMLEDLRKRVENSVRGLSVEETDFLLNEEANRIGALILHLAAVERYYQIFSFENRGFTQAEQAQWGAALSLGDQARANLVDQPIKHYLDIWDEVRAETLRLLKTKDDKWFAAKVKKSKMNHHWAWYHVMEHQANHMGQIRLIISRMDKD